MGIGYSDIVMEQYRATRVCLSGPYGYKRLLSLHGAGESKNGCLIAVKTIIYIAVLFANWVPFYESPGRGNALE